MLQKRQLGTSGLTVPAIGLGCMGMSEFYGATDETESIATIHRALELGVGLLDTADMYGAGANERLLAKALRGRRDEVVLATKFGIRRDGGRRWIDNSPAYVRESVEASLQRLETDRIDLYYVHRRDEETPIEETMGALAELVAEGKIGHIGLSEVSAETLRAAHAVHPVSALQSEYSLWTRELELDVLPAARELGVGFVAYSPLGRGMLTGKVSTDDLAEDDFRRANPRFTGENLTHNLKLVDAVRELAGEKGCSAAQLALAWVLAQGDDMVPIPGTKRVRYLEENLAAAGLELSAADLERLDAAVPIGAAAGERYAPAGMPKLDK
ncbi:MAG TPA: aldo/keto reductase [Solirubrobacterales bacterium]|nr:aldo/keto reductase [Solirubrobacterales bacterium]